MLVVISIIGLLVSLLLPALAAAKEKANAISCIGNQRQLAHVMTNYGDDYGGWLPPIRMWNDPKNSFKSYYGDVWGAGTATTIVRVLEGYEHGMPLATWGRTILGPQSSIFLCPSDLDPTHILDPNNVHSTTSSWSTGYGVNMSAWAGIPTGEDWNTQPYWGKALNLSLINKPSDTVMTMDAGPGYGNCTGLL